MQEAAVTADQREARFGLKRPHPVRRLLELRALLEAALLVPSAPVLAAQQRGDGRQVMTLPGFLGDDGVMWPLRRYLNYLGYEALPWNIGRNYGRPEQDAERIIGELNNVRRPDEPITLIGWSLGGVIAREVARRAPEAVREVITLGTPVEGGPKYTTTAKHFARRQKIDLDQLEQHIHELNLHRIECPLTIFYSRSDAIVDWRAAIDRYNPQARHRRVAGSHMGLVVSPLIWRQLARTLSQETA